jgi:hypothetical protein
MKGANLRKKITKKGRKKYERKSLTPTQRILALQDSNQEFQDKIIELTKELSRKENQNRRLVYLLDEQYAEVATLAVRNVTLIEAVEVIARVSGLEKQQRKFNASNNNLQVVNECEAGYAHDYEKGRLNSE